MKKVINTLMALMVIGTMTLASCSTNAPADTPRAAVEQFLGTLVKGDVEAALNMVEGADEATAEEKAFVVQLYQSALDDFGGFTSYEITDEKIDNDGNTAKMKVKYVYGNGEEKTSVEHVVKTEKGWTVQL